MRRSAFAVAVVTVFTMVLALAGSAGAAVTGSVWDPEDVPPEVLADGTFVFNPDLQRLEVSHDAATGTLTGTLTLWHPLGGDGGSQLAYLNFEVGSGVDTSGACTRATTGDPYVSLELYRERFETLLLGAMATFYNTPFLTDGRVTTTDWRTFDFTIQHPSMVGLNPTCVFSISWWTDQARDFTLTPVTAPAPEGKAPKDKVHKDKAPKDKAPKNKAPKRKAPKTLAS
jgi:hypothetical protein